MGRLIEMSDDYYFIVGDANVFIGCIVSFDDFQICFQNHCPKCRLKWYKEILKSRDIEVRVLMILRHTDFDNGRSKITLDELRNIRYLLINE